MWWSCMLAGGLEGRVSLLGNGAGGALGGSGFWHREASVSQVLSHFNPFLALCAMESSLGEGKKKGTPSEIIAYL